MVVAKVCWQNQAFAMGDLMLVEKDMQGESSVQDVLGVAFVPLVRNTGL